MAKEVIYLTDIMLHVRGGRQTVNFAKAALQGRMYNPLPKDYATKDVDTEAHTMKFRFDLPPDLQERIKKGEVEIMIPEGGIDVYPGPDLVEKMRQFRAQQQRMGRHSARLHTPRKKRRK